MIYWIQATLYGLSFYAIYQTMLRNKASFKWNRYFLLATAIVPLIIPFVTISAIGNNLPNPAARLAVLLQEIQISPDAAPRASTTWLQLVPWAYAIVAAGLLTRLVLQYSRAYKLTRKSSKPELLPGGAILLKNTGFGPGSFGRYIFIPGNSTAPTILQHELAHVRFGHSKDVLLIRLLQSVFWAFPHIHIISSELQMTHEFEADSSASSSPTDYGQLLLGEIFGIQQLPIAHTFFHHPIKRRLAMLQQKHKSRRQLRTTIIRSGFAGMILASGIIYLQSCSRTEAPSSTRTLSSPAATTDVYKQVEQMPVSTVDIPTFLAENIKYPMEAKEKGIEGRVLVKFVVDKEGKVTKPEVLKSPDQSLSDEAVRVIMSMPPWKPGMQEGKAVNVYFVLPISFKLQ